MTGTRVLPTDLLVTPSTPTVDRGRAVRAYGVVAALARHRDVDMLFERFGAADPAEAYIRLPQVSSQETPPAHGSPAQCSTAVPG
jgi:hypothetical protein